MDKYDIWKLTLPQLSYYLKRCKKHIEFTVKIQPMGMGIFGGLGGIEDTSQKEDIDDGYKEATEEDIEWLSRIL